MSTKKILCALLVLFLLIGVVTTPAFAQEASSELFQNLETSDGAETDAILSQLANQFNQDPITFLTELEKQNTSIQNLVFENFAFWAIGDDEFAQELKETINSVATEPQAQAMISVYNQMQSTVSEENLPTPDAFDITGVKELISTYREIGFQNNDEEFYNSLINYYLADNNLFVKAISNLTDEEVITLGNKMKIVSEKFDYNFENQQLNNNDSLSLREKEIAQKLDTALNTDNISKQEPIEKTERALPPIPTIGAFYYSGTMEVGKTVTLTLPLTDTTATNTTRNYRVKVYCVRNGVAYQKINTTYTIPVGSHTTSKQFSLVFTNPGQFTTRVEVLSTDGTILTSRTGKNPDTTYGYWRIAVKLKEKRSEGGTFTLYDAANTLICTGPALGKSASGAAMNVNKGNTPTGNYTGVLGAVQTDTQAYGPYKVVKLTGKNNPYVPPRSGIWIHGGRNQETLTPTNGCVRVFNADQLKLQNNITSLTSAQKGHYTTGNVSITEIQ